MTSESVLAAQNTPNQSSKPNLLFKEAIAALSKENPNVAAESLRRAISLRYARPLYHLKLGEAYQAMRNFPEATAAFRTAIRLKPDLWQAHIGLGKALNAQGNEAEATHQIREGAKLMATERKENLYTALRLLGYRLLAMTLGQLGRSAERYAQLCVAKSFEEHGDVDHAIKHYRAALEISPDHVEGLTALGRIYRKIEKYDQAVETLREVEDLAPNDAQVQLELGLALAWQGHSADGQVLIERVLANKPNWAAAHTALGWALQLDGDSHRAKAEFEQALRLDSTSESIDAKIGIASCLEDAGRADEAIKHWNDVLSENPCDGYARFRTSRTKKYQSGDPEIHQVERCLESMNVPTVDRRYLNFSAGKIYDDIGDVDRAFDCYDLANHLEDVIFDLDEILQRFDSLTRVYTGDLFTKLRDYGDPTERPIFIVGMPRSGTSLIEQILSRHPAVFAAGELNHLHNLVKKLPEFFESEEPYPDCVSSIDARQLRTLSGDYLDRLPIASAAAGRVIDKMPGNFEHLGLIQILFPNARIIHCIRNPLATCLSIYFMPFRESHAYRTDLTRLGHYYRQYQKLMEHWQRELLMPLFEIAYEDVVAKPEESSRLLLEFCGLEWDDRCLKFYEADRLVHTASNLQVRRPIFTSSVFRHQRYAAHLEPLRQILQE